MSSYELNLFSSAPSSCIYNLYNVVKTIAIRTLHKFCAYCSAWRSNHCWFLIIFTKLPILSMLKIKHYVFLFGLESKGDEETTSKKRNICYPTHFAWGNFVLMVHLFLIVSKLMIIVKIICVGRYHQHKYLTFSWYLLKDLMIRL